MEFLWYFLHSRSIEVDIIISKFEDNYLHKIDSLIYFTKYSVKEGAPQYSYQLLRCFSSDEKGGLLNRCEIKRSTRRSRLSCIGVISRMGFIGSLFVLFFLTDGTHSFVFSCEEVLNKVMSIPSMILAGYFAPDLLVLIINPIFYESNFPFISQFPAHQLQSSRADAVCMSHYGRGGKIK